MADFQVCISVPLKWNSLILKEHGYYFFQSTFVSTNILAEKIEIGKNLISKSEILLFFHRFCEKEYPFKQNKYILKNMKVLLYTYFYISLNVLRPTFNVYIIYFFHPFQISGKLRSTTFPYLWAPAPVSKRQTNPSPRCFYFQIFFEISALNCFLCKMRFQKSSNYCNKND